MILNKVCPKCNTTFVEDVNRGYGRTYCSRSCANSRSITTEVKRKIAHTAKNTWNTKSEENKARAIDRLRRGNISKTKSSLERLLTSDTKDLGHSSRKKKVFLEQNEKCNRCGVVDWNGQPLSFELEHIDGNKHNNARDNLEVLCPNCHSQTHTWRGRNNKHR